MAAADVSLVHCASKNDPRRLILNGVEALQMSVSQGREIKTIINDRHLPVSGRGTAGSSGSHLSTPPLS